MMAIEPVVNQRSMFKAWSNLIGDASAAVQICRSWLEHVEGTLSTNIFALVSRFAPSRCTVRHDRVYAILGLASDASSCIVDYNMSLTGLVIDLISKCVCDIDQLIGFYRALGLSDKTFLDLLRPRDSKSHVTQSGDGSVLSQGILLDSILDIVLVCHPSYYLFKGEYTMDNVCKCDSCMQEHTRRPTTYPVEHTSMSVYPSRGLSLRWEFRKGVTLGSERYVGTFVPSRDLLYFDHRMQSSTYDNVRAVTMSQFRDMLLHQYEDVGIGSK